MANMFNKKQLLEKVKKSDIKRVKATYTIEASIYDKFKAECKKQKVIQSRVIEEFMKTFINE